MNIYISKDFGTKFGIIGKQIKNEFSHISLGISIIPVKIIFSEKHSPWVKNNIVNFTKEYLINIKNTNTKNKLEILKHI